MFEKLKASRGATIIEYALIAALIAIVAITAMKNLGTSVKDKMSTIASELSAATPPNTGG